MAEDLWHPAIAVLCCRCCQGAALSFFDGGVLGIVLVYFYFLALICYDEENVQTQG